MSHDANEKINLDVGDLGVLSVLERVGSILSLIGCMFIIGTFCCFKAFHKPVNRLVFYASFGNAITNIATLMARTYIGSPDSAGCQTQAFLIQMFMPADAFWMLAMAINVYLTFYHKFDAIRLRKMELPYLLACYGIPAIPAFIYLFIRDTHGHRVYGNATLWCWVSKEWGLWRIFTFYGPVWVIVLIIFLIYIRTGGDIYRNRKLLRNFNSRDRDGNVAAKDAITPVKTTEVSVTSSEANKQSNTDGEPQHIHRPESTASSFHEQIHPAYSVTITANGRISALSNPFIADNAIALHSFGNQQGRRFSQVMGGVAGTAMHDQRYAYEVNNAAWSYAKCALLFFTALLITWIPSSANRLYSVIHSDRSLKPLEFISAFVLPLQGFWNAAIYIVTSWKACKSIFRDMRYWWYPTVTELVEYRRNGLWGGEGEWNKNQNTKTESTTELANGRQ